MCVQVVLGGVGTLRDAADWLGYTYLHVRMLQAPTHYGVTPDEVRGPVRRRIIIHSPSQNCTALFEDRQQELLHCHLLKGF